MACDSHAIAMDEAFVEQGTQDSRCAAHFVQIKHHKAATWFQIGKVGDLGTEALEIGQSPFNLGFSGDSH